MSRPDAPRVFTIAELLEDPRLLLFGIDLSKLELRFVEATRRTYESSSFLDSRIVEVDGRLHGVGIRDLWDLPPPADLRIPALLCHTSFCCSTLLARALELPDRSLVLREPWGLRDLADARRTVRGAGLAESDTIRRALSLALTLYAKRFAPTEAVVIKPTNLANNLLDDALTLRPTMKALLLSSDLRSFVIATLRKPDETKAKMVTLARNFSLDDPRGELLPGLDLPGLQPAEAAVAAWHYQRRSLAAIAARHGATRVRSLDAATLLTEPLATLRAVDGFLGLGAEAAALEAVATGPVFRANAKDAREPLDATMRAVAYAATERAHAAEIAAAFALDARIRTHGATDDVLPHPLELG